MRRNAGEDAWGAGLVGIFIAKARNSENAKFGGVEQKGDAWQVGAGNRKRADKKMADKKMGIGECFLGGRERATVARAIESH
jgi:hypothetical protein